MTDRNLIKTRVTWECDVDFDPSTEDRKALARKAAEHAYTMLAEAPGLAARVFDVTFEDGQTYTVELPTGTVYEVRA